MTQHSLNFDIGMLCIDGGPAIPLDLDPSLTEQECCHRVQQASRCRNLNGPQDTVVPTTYTDECRYAASPNR